MEIANVFTIECGDEMEHEGFRIRETGLGPRMTHVAPEILETPTAARSSP